MPVCQNVGFVDRGIERVVYVPLLGTGISTDMPRPRTPKGFIVYVGPKTSFSFASHVPSWRALGSGVIRHSDSSALSVSVIGPGPYLMEVGRSSQLVRYDVGITNVRRGKSTH